MAEEQINELKTILFLILLGEGDEQKKAERLAYIADKCGISDEDDFVEPLSEYSATGIFVNNSMDYLLRERPQYDEWCEYLKKELESLENYELLSELHL
jgi:hypothetical protein